MGSPRFDYVTKHFFLEDEVKEEEWLRGMGYFWELVAVIPGDRGIGKKYYFKRQMTEEEILKESQSLVPSAEPPTPGSPPSSPSPARSE